MRLGDGAPAVAALVATAILWGSNHVAARAAHETVPLAALVFWRWTLALAILLPLAAPAIRRARDTVRRNAVALVRLGVVGVGLFSIFLYAGAYASQAIEVGVLNATTPLWVALFSLRSRISRANATQLIGLLLACIGSLVVITRGDLASLSGMSLQLGHLWSLLSAMSFALFAIEVPRVAREVPVMALTALTALAATVLVFLPAYLASLAWGEPIVIRDGSDLAAGLGLLAYIALGPTLLANLLWTFGNAHVGATRAGAFLYLTPIASAFLSVLLLGESLRTFHVVSLALIISGLVLIARAGRR